MESDDRKTWRWRRLFLSVQRRYTVAWQASRVRIFWGRAQRSDWRANIVWFHVGRGVRLHFAATVDQTDQAKGHWKNRWSLDSANALQSRQLGAVGRPQLISLSRVGHRLRTKSHMRKLCFGIPHGFHTVLNQGTLTVSSLISLWIAPVLVFDDFVLSSNHTYCSDWFQTE